MLRCPVETERRVSVCRLVIGLHQAGIERNNLGLVTGHRTSQSPRDLTDNGGTACVVLVCLDAMPLGIVMPFRCISPSCGALVLQRKDRVRARHTRVFENPGVQSGDLALFLHGVFFPLWLLPSDPGGQAMVLLSNAVGTLDGNCFGAMTTLQEVLDASDRLVHSELLAHLMIDLRCFLGKVLSGFYSCLAVTRID